MDDLSVLVDKISNDPMFVNELAADQEATLKKNNIHLSNEVLKTMKGMDAARLRELAANYEFDKAAC